MTNVGFVAQSRSAASETVQQTLTYQPTIEPFESGTGKKGFLLKAGSKIALFDAKISILA